jgi:hypothetical protein
MSYFVDIIDNDITISKAKIELASGGGIELRWNGADKKKTI